MQSSRQFTFLGGLIVSLLSCVSLAKTPDGCAQITADTISQFAGSKATLTNDGVARISWPRSDVSVKIEGLQLKPFAGLGTWAAFSGTECEAMVMGDTVLFEDEVNPAIDAAFANGLQITGLHNHFFFDNPKVFFMHIGGHGDAKQLAAAVKIVWAAAKEVRLQAATPSEAFGGQIPVYGSLNTQELESIIGHKSESQPGVFKVTLGKDTSMHGMPAGASMGVTTWAAISGNDSMAVMDGDFAMTASEVQPVLHALRKAKINIVALHNHMIGESPAIFFTHFWGKGSALELAKGFKAALDAQANFSDR